MAESAGPAPFGEQLYTTPGTYSWIVPAGVFSVSVVCVGGGGYGGKQDANSTVGDGGRGGSLSYRNNITVTPGQSVQVIVGATGSPTTGKTSNNGTNSSCLSTIGRGSARLAGDGDGGGSGGSGSSGISLIGVPGSGGGAGGYSGSGGNGATSGSSTAGQGGGGGGGSSGELPVGKAGGGVGLLGQGANGVGGNGAHGTGGSGGTAGGDAGGGLYGGGGAGGYAAGSPGGSGAVRIIWPGSTRQFPSTNTAN